MELLFYIFGPIVVFGSLLLPVPFFVVGGVFLAYGSPWKGIASLLVAALLLLAVIPVDVHSPGTSTFWPWPLVIAVFLGRVTLTEWLPPFNTLFCVGVVIFLAAYLLAKLFALVLLLVRRLRNSNVASSQTINVGEHREPRR